MSTTDTLLQSLQTTLDALAQQRPQQEAQMATQKEATKAAQAARKQLADLTKQLKRSVKTVEQATASWTGDDSEEAKAVLQTVGALCQHCRTTIKAYQEEIDALTRRCKSSEAAFGSQCQELWQLDAAAAVTELETLQAQQKQLLQTVETVQKELTASQQEVEQLKKEKSSSSKKSDAKESSGMSKQEREELVQLRREVAEYEVEFRSLKNQDITIRKLESRIAELQESSAVALEAELSKAKDELAETEGRRAAEALEREAALERKLQTLELQLQAERAGREATDQHLLATDQGVAQREAAWEAQRRILVDDAERVRELLQTATRERDELRLQVAAVLPGSGSASGTTQPAPSSGGLSTADLMLERKAYEAEVAELSETSAMLRDELRSREEAMAQERRTLQSTIENLERQQVTLSDNVTRLQSQLACAPSQEVVDSMKRELRILKRLEYNAGDADDVDADIDPEVTAGVGVSEEKDLESVLVSKLRRAESDLVTERVSKTELSKECDELKASLVELEKAKEESDNLAASLEKDLERAIATPAKSPEPKKRESELMVAEENPATLQSILDPDAPPPPAPTPASPTPSVTKNAAEKAEDDHSVATIVMAQRDRLRARCEALEAERDSFKRELQGQVQASESLKADNTKLYEKVRYLQNYSKTPPGRGGSGALSRGGSGGDRDLDLEALEQRYEASVDPFRQFSKAERQRKLGEMSPMERTVFMVAKTVLATKEMRTGLFFYVLAMHLLVFITTYHWSHAEGCLHTNNEHLAHLPPALPAHIQEQMAANLNEGAT